MKIKVFITTYKNEDFLRNNVESLIASDLMNYDNEINVINNFTDSFESEDFLKSRKVRVFHNVLRPDFSTGHLSRNWNQSIINGFKDLRHPDCDILVLCQDDNVFQKEWCSNLIEVHKKYDFLTMGGGDQFHSYLPEHIRKVGLWDERFCNIGYQEADFFIRSYLYNKDRSSINDPKHKRVHNAVDNFYITLDDHLIGGMRGDESHRKSLQYHSISKSILMEKWGDFECNWTEERLNKLPKNSLVKNYIYYPYFEKDIYDLSSKGYVL